MVLIDADAFIGLWVEEDVHNTKAGQILDGLEDEGERLITSWQVIDEVTTKLSYIDKKENVLEFLRWIAKSEIKIVYVDERLAKKVMKKFQAQKSKRVSLTDCTNLVIAEETGVKKIFSFDKVYEQNGFKLLS